MILRPPGSTRTDTLCPYTTLFRSTRGRFRRFERMAVDPVRDAILLPQQIVVAIVGTHHRGLSFPHGWRRQRSCDCWHIGRLGLLCRGGCHRGSSEEHTSELQSLMRLSYAVFRMKKKTTHN